MTRLIVLGLLVVLAVWLIRRALRGNAPSERPPSREEQGPPEGDLVICARCGLHLPRGEATGRKGVFFCSEDHARLGPGR